MGIICLKPLPPLFNGLKRWQRIKQHPSSTVQGLDTGTLSCYIKPAKGKSPALFGKAHLGSSKKEESAHQYGYANRIRPKNPSSAVLSDSFLSFSGLKGMLSAFMSKKSGSVS